MMRLVASSDPQAVRNAEAGDLICERLVLANAVCDELERCGGRFEDRVPATALMLLLRWVRERFQSEGVETHASDGLKDMVVPSDMKEKMVLLRHATWVCEDLAMLWTADTRSEFQSDSKRVAESLAAWRACQELGVELD